ncbi:MAG: hydroxyphenylacetyl-CoA thioesterase PaaI, partial [Balneolaceae bacterium]|nr:hydroxyphenylacetyl-CoA thioesterase PaaI [Balneolaceae bacterium]
FSQWLGIEIGEIRPGAVELSMTVREEMTNGFGLSHGGIAFSLADSALAFASNTHGRIAVALENNINYVKKVKAGDRLSAEATEVSKSRRIGVYKVSIENQDGAKIADFRGTVFRTGDYHFGEDL